MIDMACAALCDPHATGFNPALPVVVVDLHLDGAELTLFTTDKERLTRKDFHASSQRGVTQLLKQLTGTMGNRFLRHTAFDILEDGRIEQTFFRQTKEFLDQRREPNIGSTSTPLRAAYEMVAKREQLDDRHACVRQPHWCRGVQSFVRGIRRTLRSPAQSPYRTAPLSCRGWSPVANGRIRAALAPAPGCGRGWRRADRRQPDERPADLGGRSVRNAVRPGGRPPPRRDAVGGAACRRIAIPAPASARRPMRSSAGSGM